MAEIKINGQEIDIDIRAELESYDWEYRAQWSDDKLIAQSPFRDDRAPSFYVHLDGENAGTWGDSGAIDEYYSKGGFVKLLAYLRGETTEETAVYLLIEYGRASEGGEIKIRAPRLKERAPFRPMPETLITPAISPYLTKRGITEDVQRMAGVGYGQHKGFCAIPWRQANGALANVMYRATRGKTFFYTQGGQPIGKCVWGIDLIHKENAQIAVICEAPIDALTWLSAGMAAIAAGGVNLTDEQADIIKRSPIETLILGGDNDAAGAKLNAEVERKLQGHVRLLSVNYGEKKDANASGVVQLKRMKFEVIPGPFRLGRLVR